MRAGLAKVPARAPARPGNLPHVGLFDREHVDDIRLTRRARAFHLVTAALSLDRDWIMPHRSHCLAAYSRFSVVGYFEIVLDIPKLLGYL